MSIYYITPEQFDKLNKSLCGYLDLNYQYIHTETLEFEKKQNGWGGKTIGTTGYTYTDEQRKNISDSLKGKKSRFGKIHTEETKQKISQKQKGKKATLETKQKMSESRKGRIMSEETRKKISEKTKQRYNKKITQ